MFDRPGIEFDRRLATLERRLRDLASAPNDAGDNLVEPYLGLVWLLQGDGSDAITYPATSAGVTSALAAAGSGDAVRVGPGTYTSNYSISASVALYGSRASVFTGQITLGAGASQTGITVDRSLSDAGAISAVVGPSSGIAYIRDCYISAVNSGAGAAYGVNVGNGNLETYNSYFYGDDWAAYWTGTGIVRDIGSRWITTTSDSSGLFNEEFATDVTGWTTSGQVNDWAWDADHQGRTGLAYIEAYWAGPGTLARASQTIALPAGTYTVDALVYTTAGYNGYGIQVTGDAANSDTDSTESAWTALTFNFTLTSAGTVVISFFIENDNPIPLGLRHLYVDYIRLTRSGGWATTSPASNPALLVTVGAMLSGAPVGAVNPGWSDRAAWDLSVEDKHASDINASALTRHLPTPPSASYGVVSDGTNWVASGSAMAQTAAGTAGRLAEYSGSVALTPSTLVKTGAGVLTLDAASAYTLTVPATGTAALLQSANVFTANQKIQNTAPSLELKDIDASAKSLTIDVDANVVNMRESAGAAGSLLVLDLANNRVGVRTTPTRTLDVAGVFRTTSGSAYIDLDTAQLTINSGTGNFKGYLFTRNNGTGAFEIGTTSTNPIRIQTNNGTDRQIIYADGSIAMGGSITQTTNVGSYVVINTAGNFLLGTTSGPATGTKALTVASGTAVAAAVTDAFSLYSANMAGVDGKAWPHIYGEDTTSGALVVGVGAASQLTYWTANNVVTSGSAAVTHAGIANFVVGGTPPSANATTVISAVNCSASGDLARIRIISGSAGQSILELGDSADTDIGAIVYDQTTDAWSVRTNNTSNRLVVSGSGNVGVAVTTFGTSASTVFAIGEGVAPTTAPANMVQMWSANVNAAAGYNGLHKRTETTNVVEIVPGVTIKTDTGRTANPYEGLMEINTFDNLIAMYADGGWRTLATW